MIFKNKYLLILTLLLLCQCKVKDISTCHKLYEAKRMDSCVDCVKDYLKDHPDNEEALLLYSKCAFSDEDLNTIHALLNLHNPAKNQVAIFMAYGDVNMKQKDYVTAYGAYYGSRMIDSTYKDVNYKAAHAYLNFQNLVGTNDRGNLSKVLYLLDEEIKYNPNNRDAVFLKYTLMESLEQLKAQ